MITHMSRDDAHAYAELWFAEKVGWTLWLGEEHRTLKDFDKLLDWGRGFSTATQARFISELETQARGLPGFPAPVFGPGYQDIQLAGGGGRCDSCGDGDHVELSITFGLMWTYSARLGCVDGLSGTAQTLDDLISKLKNLRREYRGSPELTEVLTGAIAAHTALNANPETAAYLARNKGVNLDL